MNLSYSRTSRMPAARPLRGRSRGSWSVSVAARARCDSCWGLPMLAHASDAPRRTLPIALTSENAAACTQAVTTPETPAHGAQTNTRALFRLRWLRVVEPARQLRRKFAET